MLKSSSRLIYVTGMNKTVRKSPTLNCIYVKVRPNGNNAGIIDTLTIDLWEHEHDYPPSIPLPILQRCDGNFGLIIKQDASLFDIPVVHIDLYFQDRDE